MAAVLHLRESVNLAQKADQGLRYFLKSNFCITKETGEHNLIQSASNASDPGA
jgi:hypothetical protein